MYTCTLCHFSIELDDVELRLREDRCVCLRCFIRETGTVRPLPEALRNALNTALEVLAPAPSEA